jgi:DNA topoisomerase-3
VQALEFDKKLGKRFVDDAEVEDHSALMPTENLATGLTNDQKQIYDMVARRFIAAFFPNRLEDKTTLITVVGTETFKTIGSVLVDAGWSQVEKVEKAKEKDKGREDDDTNEALPKVSPNDLVEIEAINVAAKQTKPPKRMTEADLLAAMQSAGKELDDQELKGAMKDCGLGTPATRAAIIEKLLDAGTTKFPKEPFVIREKKGKSVFLVPTPKGKTLIEVLPIETLKSPELTGQWEAGLEKVRREETSRETFMKDTREFLNSMVNEMTQISKNMGTFDTTKTTYAKPKDLEESCPRCGGKLQLKSWEGRYYVACTASKGKRAEKICYFRYDTDAEGNPTIKCNQPGCDGRVSTTKDGKKVCADCQKWQDNGSHGSSDTKGNGSKGAGKCPKCNIGTISKRTGQYGPFIACSDKDGCGLIYSVDQEGKPLGGTCSDCKGPCKKTSKGNICAVCGTWQKKGKDDK